MQRKKFHKTTIFLIVSLLLLVNISCEKKINHNLNFLGNEFIVIESIITNENTFKEVKITRSLSDVSAEQKPVSNAIVVIYDNLENIYTFTENDTLKGMYISDNKFIATVDRTYTLEVKINDSLFIAKSEMIPVTDFELFNYTATADSLYQFSSSPPNFLPNENSMYEVFIDFSHLPKYANLNYNENHKLMYFYTLSSLDVPEFFAPDAEKIKFPKNSLIKIRKYSLTTEHADFIRSILLETQWRGGIFDLEQGNVQTNFSGGALGYFGVCSVIEKNYEVE